LCALAVGGCAIAEEAAVDAGPDDPIADAATDAADPDAAIDAGCTDSFVNLLANADFEGGNVDWTEVTNGGVAVIREDGNGLPFAAEAGVWAALILGFNNAAITLSQTVSVPADATALRLTGYRCWVTEEGMGEFDTMTIELRDDAGAPLETLMAITNEDAAVTCAWELFEIAASDSMAGADIELVLEGSSDVATVTSFAFDTLALEAGVCRF
jgi:hypothetical protein